MGNSIYPGSNSNEYYSTMDARQSISGMRNASKPSPAPYHPQILGIAALTPPSMTDSSPSQSPVQPMEDYPARVTRHSQPTPPPETAQVAQHMFAPFDGSRDTEPNAQARRHLQNGPQSASQKAELSLPSPITATTSAAQLARHPAQCQPLAVHVQEYYQDPGFSASNTLSAHAARMMMPPPPPPPPRAFSSMRRNGVSVDTSPSATKAASITEWSANMDPSLRTHYGLPKWSHASGVAHSDCNTTHGNVTSPTSMVGLPFGSTIELANNYR